MRSHLIAGKVRNLYEADIRGYFNHIDHEWLGKMIGHRIAGPVIQRLIGRWLRAGVMQADVVVRQREGSPKGADQPGAG